MDHSGAVALDDCLDDLAEKVLGHRFGQGTALGDEVEQVLARLHALHDDDERVARVASVQQLDDAAALRHLVQEAVLERDSRLVHLSKR